MFPQGLLGEAEVLLERYRGLRKRLCTAESCTGGLVSALLTEIPGSSDVLDRAFVTYSNEAKQQMVSVPEQLLRSYGAVSSEVAAAMAVGALAHSDADVALSITGIAGPGGATEMKPVGLVHFGICRKGASALTRRQVFKGERRDIRLAAVGMALRLLGEEAS